MLFICMKCIYDCFIYFNQIDKPIVIVLFKYFFLLFTFNQMHLFKSIFIMYSNQMYLSKLY